MFARKQKAFALIAQRNYLYEVLVHKSSLAISTRGGQQHVMQQ